MTTQYVAGATPVTFISEDVNGNAGKQYQIPLAALTVSGTTNQPDVSTWISDMGPSLSATDQTLATNLIASLTAQGFLIVVTPT